MKFYHSINLVISVVLKWLQPHRRECLCFQANGSIKYLTTPQKGLPSRAIAQANAEVQQVLNDKKKQKKRGPYNQ